MSGMGDMNDPGLRINLSLISHTNAGKTTLARTLLAQDVGEVRDAPHVTEFATAYTMLGTEDGLRLVLWDTPGFGDSARLLQRLRQSGNPIGWFLSQVWDRWRERPFWCSQQAVRNAREEADVILYLVNAAEEPADAGYVALEMQILEWIGKPVLLLLNQLGAPRDDGHADLRRWRKHMERFAIVADVLELDAFARCWVQEDELLARITPLLEAEKRPAFERLAHLWQARNEARFAAALEILSGQLARAACDREALPGGGWTQSLKNLLGPQGRQEEKQAMERLAQRLDADIRASTGQLIHLHGLQGEATAEVLRRMRTDYATSQPLREGPAALLGGLVSGALGGLAADLAAGGLTFGGGMVAGGILGALGASGAAYGINLVRGEQQPGVRWSGEFFTGLLRSALLRYLAVAHYGRGRGDYAESEHPLYWQEMVQAVVAQRQEEVLALWERGKPGQEAKLQPALQKLLEACARQLLAQLYPR